jgi:hypothetical protein
MSMRRRTAGLLAALSLVVVAPAGQAVAGPGHQEAAHAACSYHRVLGQRKCLQAGEYCIHTRRANRDYHRAGYHCGKRDRNNRYHLVYH